MSSFDLWQFASDGDLFLPPQVTLSFVSYVLVRVYCGGQGVSVGTLDILGDMDGSGLLDGALDIVGRDVGDFVVGPVVVGDPVGFGVVVGVKVG